MTSAEPIRPVAPNEGLLVRRAESLTRVTRQRHDEEDQDARDRRREEDRRHDALAEQHERIWTTRPDAAPAQIAGAYDDHGRTGDPGSTAPRRHLDASA
jgi:hypothetical protein